MIRSALPVLCLALLGAACAHRARPVHHEPLSVEAGVPVRFGSAQGPELVWRFGDSAAEVKGAEVTHAFTTPGTYLVHGRRGEAPFERVEVTVRPRPVLHAVPPDAEWALFVPQTRGTLEPAVDFLERALSGVAAGLAEKQPFVRYALELSAGPPPEEMGLDPEEGLAAFVLPELPALVAAVGITDPARALDFARRQLAQEGLAILRSDERALLLEDVNTGERLFAFVDRGYLYLARLDAKLSEAGAAERLERTVQRAPSEGLAKDTALAALQTQVPEGGAYLFMRSAPQAGFASFQFAQDAAEVHGLWLQGAPLWPEDAQAAASTLAPKAPEGVVAALTVSVPPLALARILLTSDAGTEEERRAVEALAQVLTGEAWAAAWLDAGGTAARMAQQEGRPGAAGTVRAEVAIRDPKAATALVDDLLRRAAVPYTHDGKGRFAVKHPAGEVMLVVGAQKVEARFGEGPRPSGKAEPLQDMLRQRGFPDAFGPGRVSLAVDFGQVLRQLQAEDAPKRGQEALMLGLLAGFLSQATAVDTVLVDLSPAPQGARLRAKVTLR